MASAAWSAPATAAAAEDEAVRVYRQLRPSVVSLQNAEGSGTGIVLDKDGLILTNAHVVNSPLPFEVNADVLDDGPAAGAAAGGRGKTRSMTFKKVEIVGFHPRLDLALVRIDPRGEHVTLTPVVRAQTKADPGQHIYVIGNPGGGGMVLSKSITGGMISAADREIDGERYYQIDAAVNPGNSGGPLCNGKGEVLGLITFKFTDAEAIGFAIPLDDLDTRSFVPLNKRKTDPGRARELMKLAERYKQTADNIARTRGRNAEERILYEAYSAVCYRLALIHDPTNAAIYYNVGMLLRSLDRDKLAQAYLLRAIQLQPWDANGDPYRELGFSLIKQKQDDLALATWTEGVNKFPYACKIWEDLAVFHITHRNFADAAECALIANLTSDGRIRANTMDSIIRDARGQTAANPGWADAMARRLDPQAVVDHLDDLLAASNAARKAKKIYLTASFAQLVDKLGGPAVPDVDQTIPAASLQRLASLPAPRGATTAPATGRNGGSTLPSTRPSTRPAGDWIGGEIKLDDRNTAQITGRTLVQSTRKVRDAEVTTLAIDKVCGMEWSADAKFVFVLQSDGLLRKIEMAALREERVCKLEVPCNGFGRCKSGLVVAPRDGNELLIIGEDLKLVRKAQGFAGMWWLGASPEKDLVFVTDGRAQLAVVDTASGKPLERYRPQDFTTSKRGKSSEFGGVTATPDGKYLFFESGYSLFRVRIQGQKLVSDDGSPPIGQTTGRIFVSGDSRYVCMPSGGGNHQDGIPGTSYATFIYKCDDLTAPATTIRSGAYPTAIGFDVAARRIYAQNHEQQLIVFSPRGEKQTEYSLAPPAAT